MVALGTIFDPIDFSLYKGIPQDSCVGPVLFIVYHYDLLTAISKLYNKHLTYIK